MSTFIALGTNLPFAGLSGAKLLARAVGELGPAVRARSGVWETPPWPASAQPNYFNAIVELEQAELTPEGLYAALQAVETHFGRERGEAWGPRTLDLDIIAMEGSVGRFGDIVLPHPRMHERGFVLAPLAEITPDWRHPLLRATAAEMLARTPLPDRGRRVGDLASFCTATPRCIAKS
jgi:2-amino-4-hydroxy-6-hydroxymethyldihydropteridine diphosphokinase